MNKIGILGAGHLASYLCAGLRRADWPGELVVSPYNPDKASLFVDHFGARIATSNQHLVDDCEMIWLAVRPDQCGSTLRELNIREGQLLLSVMAGVKLATLAKLAPGATLVRAMPISAAAINNSPTTQYPANPIVESMFERLGTVTVLQSEAAFEAASANGAIYGWIVALLDQLITANSEAGLSEEEARRVVARTVKAAAMMVESTESSATDMLSELTTPGGITAQGLSILKDNDALPPWGAAFEAVVRRLRDE